MTKLNTLQREIAALSYTGFWSLDAWFSDLRNARWDEEMERDAAAGKFDKLAEAARADITAGRVRPLVRSS
jgi:hypothetical protein